MTERLFIVLLVVLNISLLFGCNKSHTTMPHTKTAEYILGNPDYPAIAFGAYRENTRDIQPTIPQLKEDLLILSAMGIRLLRTYNVHYDEAYNLLKAIRELQQENPEFEMYVMLGAWIDAKYAWTDNPVRLRDVDSPRNATEINRAVELANLYPDIIKILAVGNEAMVHWAQEYYVEPTIILHWVKHLQQLKEANELPKELWITSSDDFASWGGGGPEYHTEALNELIRSVDYISMHTYPMHNTHYNPDFWGVRDLELDLSDHEKITNAMQRALDFAVNQYQQVKNYMQNLGVDIPVHIGETGWASYSNDYYGPNGSRAVDEYKAGLYYMLVTEWARENNVTVFYFEAFDEPWKDRANPSGSENHFGLFTVDGQAKFAIWDLVDSGIFNGLHRDGNPVRKTRDGNLEMIKSESMVPPTHKEQ